MGDVEALRRGEAQVIDTHTLPPGPEVDALLKSGVHVYMAMPMIAGGELIGAVSFGGELRPLSRRAGQHRPRSGHAARDRDHPGATLRAQSSTMPEELELRVYASARRSWRPPTRSSTRFPIRCRTTCARRCGRWTATRGCSKRTTASRLDAEGAAAAWRACARAAQRMGAADRRSPRLLAPRTRAAADAAGAS